MLDEQLPLMLMTAHPDNEPILSYAQGSPERSALKAELNRQLSEVVEIPCIIGGKEVRTGQESPHWKRRVPACHMLDLRKRPKHTRSAHMHTLLQQLLVCTSLFPLVLTVLFVAH